MAILGKVLGTAAGLALGGPLGAIIGVALGHGVDKRRQKNKQIENPTYAIPHQSHNIETAFAVAFVTLAAKLSKADGRVTRDEIATLKRVLTIEKNAEADIRAIFNAAKADADGFEPYARQIASIVNFDSTMLEQILAGLVQIAAADQVFHTGEQKFINEVAKEFGFTPSQRQRIEHTYLGNLKTDAGDPYEILGVSSHASKEEIRAAYIRIIKDFHPDRLASKGLPEEFRDLGAKKTSEANVAYDRIKKERAWS